MDRTAQALQQQLATWICLECNRHYSRTAAETVGWHCEDCNLPLLDARGQKVERQKVEGKKAAA